MCDWNPKLSPSPWDGPLTLLGWHAWLPLPEMDSLEQWVFQDLVTTISCDK
jgi:hypothetical protein